MDKPLHRTDEPRDRSAQLIRRTIADRVAAEITRRGRYLTDVAAAADIRPATFSRKINAHTDFTIPELVRIAGALDVEWTIFLPLPDTAPQALAG